MTENHHQRHSSNTGILWLAPLVKVHLLIGSHRYPCPYLTLEHPRQTSSLVYAASNASSYQYGVNVELVFCGPPACHVVGLLYFLELTVLVVDLFDHSDTPPDQNTASFLPRPYKRRDLQSRPYCIHLASTPGAARKSIYPRESF